jgi:hypothetical protein
MLLAPQERRVESEVVDMTLLWILLGLAVILVAWGGWRQKRYGGTAAYDRDALAGERWHHSEYNPLGSDGGVEEDDGRN